MATAAAVTAVAGPLLLLSATPASATTAAQCWDSYNINYRVGGAYFAATQLQYCLLEVHQEAKLEGEITPQVEGTPEVPSL
ncbi:hypothetical protein [Microtetraspora malaysiensis]|uniref:hypothetical protein n=1 Tax=Microtetraspora malaysiensis TaxID=161358 RepID=UPI003D8D1682